MTWEKRKLRVGEIVFIKPYGAVHIRKVVYNGRDQLIEILGAPGIFYSWKSISKYQSGMAKLYNLYKKDMPVVFDLKEALHIYNVILQHPCCLIPKDLRVRFEKILGEDFVKRAKEGAISYPCKS